MDYTYTTKAGKTFTYCDCECHGDAGGMHWMACCDLTYKQYLNGDGTADHEKAKALCEQAGKEG